MRACLLLLLLGTSGAPCEHGDPPLVRILDHWIADYRAGRIDLRSYADVGKRSRLLRTKLVPPVHGPVTALRELQLLLDAAVEDGGPTTALRVLRIAGTGLDGSDYELRQVVPRVRAMAERALRRYRDPAIRQLVLEVARGSPEVAAGDDLGTATRAAALRAMASFDARGARQVLLDALRSAQVALRLAAVAGLQGRDGPDAVGALAEALECEHHEAVVIELAGALRDLVEAHQQDVGTRALRRATLAAVGALGRTGWRGDLALVDYLAVFRTTAAIPRLIAVLESCRDHPEWIASGKVSGLLRERAREVLTRLTGARFPADQPTAWREFWEREKASFRLAPEPPQQRDDAGRTVAGGFFGILPVGLRVVFVIDVSGSMRDPYPVAGTGAPPSKLDVAKRELIQAIAGLAPDASFDIVLFSRGVHVWRRQLQPATATNKEAAARYVRGQKPRTATDLWGGLERALGIRSLVWGDRYESNVDEVFLLSDGAPTAGDLTDPAQILDVLGDTNHFSRARINTVFLGTGADLLRQPGVVGPTRPRPDWLAPEELMEAIARGSGGRYVRPR